MATVSESLLTAEEYLRSEYADGPFELVRGKVVEATRGNHWHSIVCAAIVENLARYCRETRLGYVGCNDAGVATDTNPDTIR